MEHLYSVHGCRSFVFAGGPLSNSENSLRVQAYNEYLALRGLSNKDNPVLIGNFDFMTGCRHFETIVENIFLSRMLLYVPMTILRQDL